jgi:hypothetical protein
VNAWLILADFAQVQLSKLYLVGGGISLTGPGPTTMGVAAQLVVPWTDRSKQIPLRLALVRADDHSVVAIQNPLGESVPLEVSGAFEAVPAPGTPQGTDIVVSFAFPVYNLPLAPGSYVWELYIAHDEVASARAAFAVRAVLPPVI